ncbi:16S rRNA (cytosine(967)-C(5))-methyltransferase RsmB [uncultured Tyzzerella sp.]|uniref:16S rRNA (cytosine(967)-C(5))-methyltransferase RsmB n=1 Tax=uncultured Tyzzerella sp. TaxID=2321398 RepID=UPI002942ADE8|nr:16S rRNA (cytosine(967)-C(5))-methyltransferase RsmB [uncultured Tyzzerella sp.]
MNAREIAVYALIDILEQQSYNNLTLKKIFSENKDISTQDRAFITELVNGTLRNIIYIDYIINSFSNTKTKKMKPLILNILRISVYQIKFMEKIPTSAVCNEAVNFTKKKKFNGLSGFVNGVLRNIARNIDNIALPDEEKTPIEFLATKYSYEKWVIEKLIKQFGYEKAKEICKANALAPKVSICVNTNKITKNELKDMLIKEGMNVEEGNISNNSLYITKTKNIANSNAFKKGYFHIMDQSSMLLVEILNPKEDDVIIDVCSAPGGKSFYCSYIMKNKGKIFSRDIHSHKIELIKDTIKRLDIKNIDLELKDGTIFYKENEEIADKIIVDVPCSGFGIVRKKPDIKYTKTEDDIKELVCIQREILKASYKYVKKGGTLLYSTCTLFEEENIQNVKWFCKNYGFELCSIDIPLNIEDKHKGYITILPSMFNTDGFFIAKLKRIN